MQSADDITATRFPSSSSPVGGTVERGGRKYNVSGGKGGGGGGDRL